MAEARTAAGTSVRLRNPWGTWALSLITIGVYGLVWWYKVNRELRDVSAGLGRPLGNSPTTAVLALFPGGFIIVPAIVTYVHTARGPCAR